ncbi:MAG: type II toxin-antitoxin system VapC family toxin [bacterium]
MILTDAGPLIALIDRDEPDHKKCVKVLSDYSSPMITTAPVFTEATYILGDAGGWEAQEILWIMVEREVLQILPFESSDWTRSRSLMKKYQDQPMDLADATLLTVAERKDFETIFSLDSDFYVYRKDNGDNLTVIP